MTKTKNYALNQWDAGDPIRRADFNRDNAVLDAALREIGYVKLLDVSTDSDAKQVDLDVSGIEFTRYWEVGLYLDCGVTSGEVLLRTNQVAAGYRELTLNSSSSTEFDYMLRIYAPGKYGAALQFSRPQAGLCVAIQLEQFYIASGSGRHQLSCGGSPVTWEALTSLNFYRTSGVIPAGTRFVLRGLKNNF
jgi:hypothetical protein